jgi:hypothetical protein
MAVKRYMKTRILHDVSYEASLCLMLWYLSVLLELVSSVGCIGLPEDFHPLDTPFV